MSSAKIYTCAEWFSEYHHNKALQEAENRYFLKQRLLGAVTVGIGIATPIVLDGDATFSLIALPLGVFLLTTKKKVTTFSGRS